MWCACMCGWVFACRGPLTLETQGNHLQKGTNDAEISVVELGYSGPTQNYQLLRPASGFWGSSSWGHPTCQRPSQSLRPAKSFKMAKAWLPQTQDPGKAGGLLLPHTLGWRLNGSHLNAFPSALSGKILVLNVPLRSQPSFPS